VNADRWTDENPRRSGGKTQGASAVRAQNAEAGHDQSAVTLAEGQTRLHGEGRAKRNEDLALAGSNGPVRSKATVLVRKIVHGVPLVGGHTPTLLDRQGVVKRLVVGDSVATLPRAPSLSQTMVRLGKGRLDCPRHPAAGRSTSSRPAASSGRTSAPVRRCRSLVHPLSEIRYFVLHPLDPVSGSDPTGIGRFSESFFSVPLSSGDRRTNLEG